MINRKAGGCRDAEEDGQDSVGVEMWKSCLFFNFMASVSLKNVVLQTNSHQIPVLPHTNTTVTKQPLAPKDGETNQ